MKLEVATFGAEHEFAQADRLKPLPEGYKWDDRDVTIVNSNGVANDPKGKLYAWGGEFNTPPTETIDGQLVALERILQHSPVSVVNYRSNLHCHVGVPGLREDLAALKRFARYNAYWLRRVLSMVEPIPAPDPGRYDRSPFQYEYAGAARRYRRRLRSHHTVLPHTRLTSQLAANTVEDFFAAEVPGDKTGRPMWHAQARAAVNLRQLRETNSIEFRHFPGTVDIDELDHCLAWCRDYTTCALSQWDAPEDLDPWYFFNTRSSRNRYWHRFPTFEPYDHVLEIRYRHTAHDGRPKDEIAHNIKEIEAGRFNDIEAEAALKW